MCSDKRGGGRRGVHTDIPALPFFHVALTALIPKRGYPKHPASVGEYLRKYRIDSGKMAKTVATEVGVTQQTLRNWELGATEPEVRQWPAIIGLLGFDPRVKRESTTLGEQIRDARLAQGWSQKRLAEELHLDESTVQAWESGKVRRPFPRLMRLFEGFVSKANLR